MSNYSRGAAREREVQDQYEANGWIVTRSPQSGGEGAYDLHCSKAGYDCRLIQVKMDKRGPFAHFGPADRVELIRAATAAGAQAWLCWWPPDRKGARWLPPAGWPKP